MPKQTAKIVPLAIPEEDRFKIDDIYYFYPCIKYICREAEDAGLIETTKILKESLSVLEVEFRRKIAKSGGTSH